MAQDINIVGSKIIISNPNGANGTAYFVDSCTPSIKEIVPMTVGTEFIIDTKKDGIYILEYDNPVTTLTFNMFYFYQKSVLEDMKTILCGCGCSTCLECFENFADDEIRKILMNLHILSLKYLTSQTMYSAVQADNSVILTTVGKLFQHNLKSFYSNCGFDCIFDTYSDCLLVNEKVYGRFADNLTLKRLVAFYYKVFRYTTMQLGADYLMSIEKEWETSKIIKCMDQLGICDEL